VQLVFEQYLFSFKLSSWQSRSLSLVEMYLDQGEPTEKCGEIHFGLDYDFTTQTLKLKIIQVIFRSLEKQYVARNV